MTPETFLLEAVNPADVRLQLVLYLGTGLAGGIVLGGLIARVFFRGSRVTLAGRLLAIIPVVVASIVAFRNSGGEHFTDVRIDAEQVTFGYAKALRSRTIPVGQVAEVRLEHRSGPVKRVRLSSQASSFVYESRWRLVVVDRESGQRSSRYLEDPATARTAAERLMAVTHCPGVEVEYGRELPEDEWRERRASPLRPPEAEAN